MQRLKNLAIATAVPLLAQSVAAHETWLLPEGFAPEPGTAVTLLMTSGMGFPALGAAISQDRVIEMMQMVGDRRMPLQPKPSPYGALALEASAEEGLNCAWVQLHPRILQIDEADSVTHYLEEIGAPDSVWNHWRAEADAEVWRESYSKLARTYLRSGDKGPDSCLTAATASRFDILPLTDPTTLSAGDSLSLRVVFDGQTLAGQTVGLARDGQQPVSQARSDDEGVVKLSVDEPGRYMVYATNLRPTDESDFNWESDFVTLTFEVAGP